MARFRDWRPFGSGVDQRLAMQRCAPRPEGSRRLMPGRRRSPGRKAMPENKYPWHLLLREAVKKM